jgi:hypothetical protein
MAQAQALVALDVPERISRALALRLEGRTWRDVAARMGEGNHVDLYREARSWDAALRGDARYETLKGNLLEGAIESSARLNEALLTSTEKLSVPQLAVVAGIMADKVVNMRRADQAAAGPVGGGFAGLLEALHGAGGGKLTATIELASPVTLDVTPIK